MACRYFAATEARASSLGFYAALLSAARQGNATTAEKVTRSMMQESLLLWDRDSV
jgi:DNA-binding FadR family transcriptional regulator